MTQFMLYQKSMEFIKCVYNGETYFNMEVLWTVKCFDVKSVHVVKIVYSMMSICEFRKDANLKLESSFCLYSPKYP